MPEDWPAVLEKTELAIGACAGVVPDELLGEVAATVEEARIRLSYPEEVGVVALVGGTGSGKSSLLNALSGEDLAQTGGARPTTQTPLAVVPAELGHAMDGHLERLGIEDIHHGGRHDRLLFIDMPDTDSVEVGHRLQVERLIPVVDAVVWVLDPEKYRDATLHHQYLARLSGHAERFVFVLNQADRLPDATRQALESDLRKALAEDGISDAALVATSAAPPAGPATGIEDLVARVSERTGRGETLRRKLLSDLSAGLNRLLAATGGAGLEFEERAAEALQEATKALENGEESAAVLRLTTFLEEVAADAGEVIGSEIEQITVGIPVAVRRVAEGEDPPLSDSVMAPARALLARRARANALLADAVLALRTFGAGTTR